MRKTPKKEELVPIKIFSMESDEFFKVFLQDALVVYNPRETIITFVSSVKETLDSLSDGLPGVPDIIFLALAVPLERGAKIHLQGGFRVLKILRENSAFKNVPIIMFSKYKEKHLQKKAMALGATKYLIKGECMPRDIAQIVACSDKMHITSFRALRDKFFKK